MVILIAGHHSQREIYPIRPTTPRCFKNGFNATEDIETANTLCTVISVFYSPTLLFHRKSVKSNNTGRSERHHGANRDFAYISVCLKEELVCSQKFGQVVLQSL